MARGDQLARQWRIIQTLVTSPIYSDRVDGKGVWSVVDEYKHKMPVPFTLTELMALYFSRDLISVFKGTIFYDSLEALFQKIKTTLPAESLAYMDRVEQTLHIGFKPHKDFKRFREIIKQINDAAVNHRTIDMIYKTMSRGGEENRRKVDPYKVMFFDSTFYLIGLCHLRSEVRMFVLDRIKMMNVTVETFEIPSGFDLETYLQSPFRVIHDKPVKVEIQFDKKAAGYIKEKIWHHSQEIEPQKDGSIIFSAEVAGTEEVKHWVMSWGTSAEVLSPEFLRREIATELQASLRKYAEDMEKAEQF
jgi:predicted DNA-binding transcriptional regulator YafY